MSFRITGTILVPAHMVDGPHSSEAPKTPSSLDAVRRKHKGAVGKFDIPGDDDIDTDSTLPVGNGNDLPRHVPAQELQTEFNIPTRMVIGAIASLGGLSAVVGAIVSGLGFFSNTMPNASQARKLEERRMQMQALATALRAPSADDRAESITLLLDAGVLEDPTGALRRSVNDPVVRVRIPRWTSAIIEAPTDRPGSETPNGVRADSSPPNAKEPAASHSGPPPLPAGKP
ncbi:MAG: hypothetical protein ABI035_12705 [Gemmatimonadaceae bacterium]